MKKKSLLFYCLSAVCLSFLLPGPVLAVENDACMECHADELERDASTGHSAIMIVDLEKFTASPHGENACVDCHNDIEELNWDNDVPHGTDLVDPACADCHDETTSAYAESVHVEAEISCNDCHSYHAPVPVAGKQDVVMMQADFCGKCHDAAASHDWLAQNFPLDGVAPNLRGGVAGDRIKRPRRGTEIDPVIMNQRRPVNASVKDRLPSFLSRFSIQTK